jgi:hypothetical protein
LAPSERARLAGIIHDFSSVVDTAEAVNTGAAPVETWTPTARKLNALLDQMKALVEIPPVLGEVAKDGPDGNGVCLHHDPDAWRIYAADRNKRVREVLAYLGQAIAEHPGCEQDGAEAPSVDETDLGILRALLNRAPLLLTQQLIEANSKPRVSQRTIADRMPYLISAGLAAYPRGKKGGATITPAGRAMLDRLSDPRGAGSP